MFITTRATYHWTGIEYALLSREGFQYEGPVALCGGGPSEATQEQQQLDLQQTQQTMGFDSQLMDLFNKQYANQQSQLNFLKGVLQPELTSAVAGNGFSKPALAAMRTGATDNISSSFQNAQRALNQTERSSGDVNIPSGVNAGLDASLVNSEAQTKSGAQNQITLADESQAQSNLWNAVNALNGVAAENSPAALESGALEGGSTVAGLSSSQAGLQNAITQANSNSFLGTFGKALGGALGTGLGGAAGDAGDSELMSVFG
jgi:hypothetical protein